MCDKSFDIAIVLSNIKTCIPKSEIKYHQHIDKLLQDVFYKPPELCNLFWEKIYDHLRRLFNNGYDWEENICNIYNNGLSNYKKKYEDK